jgi:hypothetical protein
LGRVGFALLTFLLGLLGLLGLGLLCIPSKPTILENHHYCPLRKAQAEHQKRGLLVTQGGGKSGSLALAHKRQTSLVTIFILKIDIQKIKCKQGVG